MIALLNRWLNRVEFHLRTEEKTIVVIKTKKKMLRELRRIWSWSPVSTDYNRSMLPILMITALETDRPRVKMKIQFSPHSVQD